MAKKHSVNHPEVENKGISQDIFEFIVSIQDNSPIFQTLGFKFSYLGEGLAGISMLPARDYTSYAGRVNGGLLAALADNVMGMACITLGNNVRTVDLAVHYFAPVFEDILLTAQGNVINAGNRLIVAEARMFNSEGKLAAKSTGTYYRTDKIPFGMAAESVFGDEKA
ncbi:MAG: PaaI family thioesterase [Syntrophomonadaceae bacterium]|nr:PaaI family thioesterase [Syntrophomonadaceae bacterium]